MIAKTMPCCPPADSKSLERVRYFPRQLITADDLRQEQEYFRAKQRLHNRMLHGWGVVCGARVKSGNGHCEVIIEPGYVLGPFGDDIVIDREITIDLCRQDTDGNACTGCMELPDQWCGDIRVQRQGTLYIAVRYAECHSRPVRIQSCGCGCGDAECEYSRIRDSFVIKVLDTLPHSHEDMHSQKLDDFLACTDVRVRPCPPCPSEPWVVLAGVHLINGLVHENEIDNSSFRRYVASLAEYYIVCPSNNRPEQTPFIPAIIPPIGSPSDK